MYYGEGKKIVVTSKSTLTDVSGCICFAGQIDSNRDWQGQGKWFDYDGEVEEGIFKDCCLIDGRKWVLNDDGSYDYYQFTQGEYEFVKEVAKLPGFQM
jgi:hypothetical protein